MSEVFVTDAEVAVLSIVLNSPEKILDINSLKAIMFSSTPNQAIWSVIEILADDKLLPEFSLVVQKLKEKGKLERAGNVEYLSYLKNSSFKSENLREFEKAVVNNFRTKNLYSLASKVTGELDSGKEVDGILTSIREAVEGLESVSNEAVAVTLAVATKETWDQIQERIKNPGLRGLTTGLPDLDEITGGYGEEDVWIFAGRPSMGKSAVMFNSSLALGKAGVPNMIFSREMNRTSCVERILALESQVSIIDIRGANFTQDGINSVTDSIKRVKDLPIYIDDRCYSIDYVISTVRQYVRLHGVKVVFIDYLQLFSVEDDQVRELGMYSRRLKALAKELKITIVVLSQLNRLVEMRDDKRPILSDLRQSGDLEQDADLVIMLYRDEYYYKDKSKHKGEIDFLIRKFRNGPIGVLSFYFDAPTNIISPYVLGEEESESKQKQD